MDAILAGLGGLYTGISLAEKLNLPLIQAHLFPFSPTAEFPSVLTPNLPAWTPAVIRRWTHVLTRQIMWQSFRSADQIARRQVFGLPAAPFLGPSPSPTTHKWPILYGFSPAVIPTPADWETTACVTGYWFLDAEEGWEPPARLADFLQAGPPPISIGFGSMSNRDPQKTAELVLTALKQSGQRAVLLSGWGGLSNRNFPDSVLMLDSAPHAWLFPRMAAVVHHGGAGTTAAGLRAGVPSILIPFFGDQPFWGRKVAQLGVGPAPIPRKQLSAESLARAIRQAVENTGMRSRAAQLGATIQAEDGVRKAVEVIYGLEYPGAHH
jgi:UDP:flavonoid glycosyltransferase YjiC (YdhE family)